MPHGNLEMKGDNAGMAKAAELFPQHTKEYTIRRMKWLSTKIKTESKQLQDDTRWGDVAFNTWSGAPLFQFSCPHSGFLVALIVLVLTYTVWAFVQYAMRPPSEVFSMMPMTSVPPQLVELTTECSEPWACHVNATNVPPPWRWGATPTITVRYGPSSPCSSTTISLPGASNRLVLQTRVPLCYSENGDEGVLIDIPAFSLANGCTYGATGCKPFLRVRLKAVDDTGGAAGMQATIDIEPSQRKAVFVGVVAREDRTHEADGFLMFAPEPGAAVVTYKQYVADLFYEGKNPFKGEVHARVLTTAPSSSPQVCGRPLLRRQEPGDELAADAADAPVRGVVCHPAHRHSRLGPWRDWRLRRPPAHADRRVLGARPRADTPIPHVLRRLRRWPQECIRARRRGTIISASTSAHVRHAIRTQLTGRTGAKATPGC